MLGRSRGGSGREAKRVSGRTKMMAGEAADERYVERAMMRAARTAKVVSVLRSLGLADVVAMMMFVAWEARWLSKMVWPMSGRDLEERISLPAIILVSTSGVLMDYRLFLQESVE